MWHCGVQPPVCRGHSHAPGGGLDGRSAQTAALLDADFAPQDIIAAQPISLLAAVAPSPSPRPCMIQSTGAGHRGTTASGPERRPRMAGARRGGPAPPGGWATGATKSGTSISPGSREKAGTRNAATSEHRTAGPHNYQRNAVTRGVHSLYVRCLSRRSAAPNHVPRSTPTMDGIGECHLCKVHCISALAWIVQPSVTCVGRWHKVATVKL